MYPLRSRTTYTETLDNEVCVYEWIRHEVHALNATAAGVWQLCDGKTSVAEMAERLGVTQLPHAEQLIELALQEFQRKQLLDADHALPSAGPAISRRVLMRRGLTAALLPVVTSVVAPTPLQAQSPAARSQTFAFTGVAQTFIVPPGVTALRFSAFGAQGRDAFVTPGGLGGSITATLVVTPGEALVINIGGVPMSTVDIFAGGFNGGGAAGRTFPLTALAGPGGGASDVRRGGGALSNRVVVAGGGGGAGTAAAASGGAGGGTTGGDGGFAFAGEAGVGGTQTAGGAGGVSPVPLPLRDPFASGEAGALGIGGSGGYLQSGSLSHFQAGGGGGGGGYYGGGGGATEGGGGGGSSFVDPSATGVVHVQGTRAGAGLITLTW
jgi:hypothetical protein